MVFFEFSELSEGETRVVDIRCVDDRHCLILFCHGWALFWEIREHTKNVIESHIWKDDRQYNGAMIDNTMEGWQTIQWSDDRQYNGRMTDNTVERWYTIQWKDDRQYSGRLVICKVCQAGKRSSAVTPVICKVCHACRQFSAVNSVICTVCQTDK